jgi:hypothetical protein
MFPSTPPNRNYTRVSFLVCLSACFNILFPLWSHTSASLHICLSLLYSSSFCASSLHTRIINEPSYSFPLWVLFSDVELTPRVYSVIVGSPFRLWGVNWATDKATPHTNTTLSLDVLPTSSCHISILFRLGHSITAYMCAA